MPSHLIEPRFEQRSSLQGAAPCAALRASAWLSLIVRLLKQTGARTIKAVACVTLVALAAAGCALDTEEKNLQVVRARGEQFLSLLRAQQWDEASEMVLLNDAAYHRFNFRTQNEPEVLKGEIAKLFKQVYSNVKPGALVSVRMKPGDPPLASIAYRHGDLDAFNMRLSDGQWYYSFK